MPVIVATIKVKSGQGSEFEAVAQELAAAVNANEEGCSMYQLCKGDEADTYYFVEQYRDADAVAAHRASDHFKTLGRKMGAFMDGAPSILRLQEV
ncbi:putative quinol monooxygenase [Albimonas sp. CAU 1670]|uniref:putative quinol monooxygenase n=1 Tax=Albimonas sp. CAU 1670 TaxID=3032599 RepID=UPI0023DA2FEB|nr:putative quinol monooxygenase [Albimonas sp. CAU 1670]MDF2234124.1 putative quinol monooxygenase [Albimonas sp. CAU 1670]